MGLTDYKKLKVPALLREAAQILEQRGWTQGVIYSEDGRVDLTGAVLLAAYVSPKMLRAQTFIDIEIVVAPAKIATTLGALHILKGLIGDLPRWNDDPSRTMQDARRLLLQAADMVDIAIS